MPTLDSLLYARYATGDPHPKSRTFHGRLFCLRIKCHIKVVNWTCKHHTTLISMDYGHMKVVVIFRTEVRRVARKSRSVSPLGLGRSTTLKGGSPHVAHVPLC